MLSFTDENTMGEKNTMKPFCHLRQNIFVMFSNHQTSKSKLVVHGFLLAFHSGAQELQGDQEKLRFFFGAGEAVM